MNANFYETDRAIAEYLLLHYGAREEILPYSFGPVDALDFPVRCVTECVEVKRLLPQARALDLGCAVGRASFELAKLCGQVVGIDYSQRFIETARQLQRDGEINFQFTVEGELAESARALVPKDIDRSRVHFQQGDAMNLPSLGGFDVVLLANLIDRIQNPRACLERMGDLINSGGQLIITSPYTWLEEFTPRKYWLGGFVRGGKPARALDTLKEILRADFEFVGSKDLPFLIREHSRKFQWSVAEASIWIKKSSKSLA